MRNLLRRIMQRLRGLIPMRRARALGAPLTRSRTANQTAEEAREFLRHLLADGPVPAKHVFREAGENGISRRTLRRAKTELGVREKWMATAGKRGGCVWAWELPVKTEKLLTPDEVAELFGVHLMTIYKWIRKEKIRAVRVASRWRIPELELRRVDRRDTRAPARAAARLTAARDLPIDPQDGKPVALRDPARCAVAKIVDAIPAALEGQDWLTQRQIRDMLGSKVAARTVKRKLDDLVQRGLVERDPAETRQGATYKYRLASGNGGTNFTSTLGEAVEVKSENREIGNVISPKHIEHGER